MLTPSMNPPQPVPVRPRAAAGEAAAAATIDALAPRERVRNLVAARLFGELVTPTRIDRFELIRELGVGGMGAVYAAHDPRLDRAVALKVLARTGEGPEASRRLVREAQAMARLKHPNVVAVHEVGTHGEQVFVAMELVEGGTLADWLRGGPRPWREVLALLIPAGRGLAAAHAAGLVHRDFKPANVLLGADGRALVSDFGLARAGAEPGAQPLPGEAEATADLQRPLVEAHLTRTGALLGTPAYMAPEQFRGEMATARSDVFAFCVVVWEAIFGQRPFTGATIADLFHAVDHGAISPPPRAIRVPSPLRRELRRGLATNPADRHPSMPELLAALERAGRSSRLRAALIAAGAVVAGCTAALAAAYALSRPPEPEPEPTAPAAIVENPAAFLERIAREGKDPKSAFTSTKLERREFEDVLATEEALKRHARVMPSLREGTFTGLKLYGLRPESPLWQLGFKNGDTMIALDERSLATPDDWDAAMAAAAADDQVTIILKRKNEPLFMTYRLTGERGPAPQPSAAAP